MGDKASSSNTAKTIHGQNGRPLKLGRFGLHVGLGLLALWVALEFLTSVQEQILTAIVAGTTSLIEFARFKVKSFNRWLLAMAAPFAHDQETHRVTSATWFWLAMFAIALIGNELVFALTLGVLSLGDQVASLAGRRFGSIQLVNGRSLQGSLGFVVSSALLCGCILHIYFPELSTQHNLSLVFAASCSGAICELFCSRIDDNFGVGLGSGLCIWATVSWLGLS